MTHRFEVDYKERLEQQRTANNAVRLPRLGYKLYRIYDIEEKKESTPNYNMKVYKGRQSGKTQTYEQQILWAWLDELAPQFEPAYDVRWLKPKKATLLRMRGHRVEPAEKGEKPGRVTPSPVRVGR